MPNKYQGAFLTFTSTASSFASFLMKRPPPESPLQADLPSSPPAQTCSFATLVFSSLLQAELFQTRTWACDQTSDIRHQTMSSSTNDIKLSPSPQGIAVLESGQFLICRTLWFPQRSRSTPSLPQLLSARPLQWSSLWAQLAEQCLAGADRPAGSLRSTRPFWGGGSRRYHSRTSAVLRTE